MPRDTDPIVAELRAINAQLDRMEAETYVSDRHSPRFDPLRQVEAGLDALEREIGVMEIPAGAAPDGAKPK